MVISDHKIDAELEEDDIQTKKKVKKEKKDRKKKKDKKKKSKAKNDEGTSTPSASKETKEVVTEIEEESEPIVEEATDEALLNPSDDRDEIMDNENDTDYFDKSAGDERKIFLSRIPAAFNEEAIVQSLNKVFGEDSVDYVALTEPKRDEEEGEQYEKMEHEIDPSKEKEHCGFAFVTMSTVEKRNEAIEKGTIRGKVKETSKRKHTLYIRPIVRQEEGDMGDESASNKDFDACFLWKKFRCPYGDDCKFKHEGEGGCEKKKESVQDKRSNQKCFSFRTKGKCKLGNECPYSHDFVPKKSIPESVPKKDSKEKDCIGWKTKGKCRKRDKCPYRHDDAVREAFIAKKQKKVDKKRDREEKVSQPLSVRVFGLNYDTTEDDVREYFKDCGIIKEIMFPTYEDSGRSKGYCGVLFVSPKATQKACELDGQELHGRWLSVQPGKMYLKQWEQREQDRKEGKVGQDEVEEDDKVGEFGQKVKKRKKHGFKDE